MYIRFLLSAAFALCMARAAAPEQVEGSYVPPRDPLVLEKLSQWQDLKFGLFMHWGPYSQWGVVESWSLCPEDEGWTRRRGPFAADYFEYKRAYEALPRTFNPIKFQPEKWAAVARKAGMKYVVFTTKHHDGFCMFDTRQTSYRITDPATPFSEHPRSNITREIFDAFRHEGFWVGAYFSKPDWHSEHYWYPYFPPKDRNVNYDPARYPERWSAFKQFTYNQIEELMTDYGQVDILWLDGGWVRPRKQGDAVRSTAYNQDIDIPRIARMARQHQKGLIIVDRSVGGEFENYTTPEQKVPGQLLTHPWETCMTMGRSWSYVPGDEYKPARQLVAHLITIVSRGGNYLLNIGPGPEGDWDPAAYARLEEVGNWLATNGEAIYGTRPAEPSSYGTIRFTSSKSGGVVYAFLISEKDEAELPATIKIPKFGPGRVTEISLLGTEERFQWAEEGQNIKIAVPPGLKSRSPLRYAATFRLRFGRD